MDAHGHRIRLLNIMDDCCREALTVHADYSIPAAGVIAQLDILEEQRGLPQAFRVDNGPEFRSIEFMTWCQRKNIHIKYIQPGRPMQNGSIERFNKTYRKEILDAYLFDDLEELNVINDEFRRIYNLEIPHGSINDMTPNGYYEQAVNSGKLPTHKTTAEFTTITSNSNTGNKLFNRLN